MGYAYEGLITAAVLWKNPGITKEEYVKLLDKVKTCYHTIFSHEDPWDSCDAEWLDMKYHDGLSGLASLLHISESPTYQEFSKDRKDDNGFTLKPTWMVQLEKHEKGFPEYRFEVNVHERNDVLESRIEEDYYTTFKLNPGDTWIADYGGEKGVIDEILEEVIGNDKDDDGNISYTYKLRIRPIKQKWNELLYRTEEELFKEWPLFNPVNKYDWNQAEGKISTGSHFVSDSFRWKMKDGRYYFDEKSFDMMKASYASGELGYTDLVLTAEAIKHDAWKMLSRKGLIHKDHFLEDFSDSRNIFARAVLDSHTSLSAKMQGMRVNDFLRYRLSSIS